MEYNQKERIFENTCSSKRQDKENPSIQITDEHVHDSKALLELVNDVKSDKKITIGKLFAGGAYEDNNIFKYLSDNEITPCIKVRKNVRARWKKGNNLKNLSIISQKRFAKMERYTE